jgi:hypothetical protein
LHYDGFMTRLLEQAFATVSALSDEVQDEAARMARRERGAHAAD